MLRRILRSLPQSWRAGPWADRLRRWLDHDKPPKVNLVPAPDWYARLRSTQAHRLPQIDIVLSVIGHAESRVRRTLEAISRIRYPETILSIVGTADDLKRLAAVRDLCQSIDRQMPRRLILSRNDSPDERIRAVDSAMDAFDGEFVTFLEAGDRVTEDFLYSLADAAASEAAVDLLYTDEVLCDASGCVVTALHKPAWSPEFALSRNYMGRCVILRTSLVKQVGKLDPSMKTAADYDLALRVAERARAVAHVPLALFERTGENPPADARDALSAVRAALARRGMTAGLEIDPGIDGIVRIRPHSLRAETVSIIIPTRDRHQLLKTCIDSIVAKTSYSPFEIVVVDNDSSETATRELLADYSRDGRIRVVPVPGEFNFSRLNNLAVDTCRSEYVLLLNNDTEVIAPHWLEVMVAWAEQPDIGAVGAKLYFTNGSLQHSGVVLRGEGSGEKPCFHSHKKFPRDAAGYLGLLRSTCNYSAVTGACLLLRRANYLAVGGLDEQLSVAYNDIDLCLKVAARGLRIVWSAEAELYHHESASRTVDDGKSLRWKQEQEHMHRKWGAALCNDLYYNPNLSLERSDFAPAASDEPTRSHACRIVRRRDDCGRNAGLEFPADAAA